MKLRIKSLRLQRGWTVEQLADVVGMSKSYVSEIENQKKSVNNLRLDAFAKAFGVRVADLIDDSTVDPLLLEHVRRLERLSEEDRRAVLRFAEAMARPDDQG